MRILIILTYYKPYKSGLTIYAQRQAEALAELGHEVSVLTSQFDRNLPASEFDNGVKIHRLPVAFRLSKGVVMPQMPFKAWKLISQSDIVNCHLPQVDAAAAGLLAKLQRKPLVSTYHCDIEMPEGIINKLAGWGARLANYICARLSDAVVHNTRDFAEHSEFLSNFLDKLTVINPPIVVEEISSEEIDQFLTKYQIDPGKKIIGMVARLASEKGVEYLVEAMPKILKSFEDAQVVFVGNYQDVIGEGAYKEKIMPMIELLGDHWKFLGIVSETEKTAFYKICDVLVLPSINSTESFGMVQVEGMICGAPVVTTDLPGVRQPVKSTGIGKIVRIKNSQALAEGIIQVLDSSYVVPEGTAISLKEEYSPKRVARSYESLYENLLGKNG